MLYWIDMTPKAEATKAKKTNGTTSNLKMFMHQRKQLTDSNDNLCNVREYLKIIHLTQLNNTSKAD